MQNPPEGRRAAIRLQSGNSGAWQPRVAPKSDPKARGFLQRADFTPVPASSGRVCATRRRSDVSFSDRACCCAPRREKVFGEAPGVPLDRNAEARIMVYVRAYNARMKQEGQHTGPITRTFMDVLRALLYSFHNGKDGR